MENQSALEPQNQIEPRRRSPVAVVLIALVVLVAASGFGLYYFFGPCGVNTVNEASKLLVDQLNIYDEAYQVATSSPRISLIGPVTQIQQILMDTKEVVVPSCMQKAKIALVTSMEAAIRGFLAFMAQEADVTVHSLMDQSLTHLGVFTTELETVNKCAPFCSP